MSNKPQFHSFSEFAAHIKGKAWSQIKTLYQQEAAALHDLHLEAMPQWKRLSHPMSQYDGDLNFFFHFSQGQAWLLNDDKHKKIRAMLESIRADVASRESWEAKETL
jgi:hypothetical protein